MGLLGKLFGRKKFKTTDPDFGEIESFSTHGNEVGWQIDHTFLGNTPANFNGHQPPRAVDPYMDIAC